MVTSDAYPHPLSSCPLGHAASAAPTRGSTSRYAAAAACASSLTSTVGSPSVIAATTPPAPQRSSIAGRSESSGHRSPAGTISTRPPRSRR